MSLDARLQWIGKISKDQARRITGKYSHECGYNYISEEDYRENYKRYKNISKFMTLIPMITEYTDWDMIKDELGEPKDAQIAMIGPHSVGFGRAVNTEDYREYHLNILDEKYKKEKEELYRVWDSEELYNWHGCYDLKKLFDKLHPESYDEYDKEWEQIYDCYYPIDDNILKQMYEIDETFKHSYSGDTWNVFWSADW